MNADEKIKLRGNLVRGGNGTEKQRYVMHVCSFSIRSFSDEYADQMQCCYTGISNFF